MRQNLLVSSTALLWGLQHAFLNPALALILTALFDATTAQVGWSLALYNVSGLVASLVIPARADRAGEYLRPMLVSGGLTVALAVLLAVAASLPVAVAGLVAIGGPAGVGSTLLFAHLRHTGATTQQIVNTRAVVSVAWVAGPPAATFVIGALGEGAILLVIAVVAALAVVATALLQARNRTRPSISSRPPEPDAGAGPTRTGVAVIVAAFVLLQCANATAMTFMTVYVTQSLGLDVVWAGIALGVAAGLEVPALLLVGRLSTRVTASRLIVAGSAVGVVYYLALSAVTTPAGLIGIQVLNAVSFATISGTGLALFQQLVARPGLATGLYMNTRRIGAILSGPVIALGSLTALGQAGIFVACAGLALLGTIAVAVAHRVGPASP